MDIGRFVDSAAIRAYLKEQNYPFSAQEAAFLVYHCKTASLEERLRGRVLPEPGRRGSVLRYLRPGGRGL